MSFLNYNLLYDYTQAKEENLWYCKTKGIDAKGTYNGKKFIVLAGSTIAKKATPALKRYYPSAFKIRQEIIENEKKAKPTGEFYELQQKIEFNSLSASASVCSGQNISGLDQWKNKGGETMREVNSTKEVLNNKQD